MRPLLASRLLGVLVTLLALSGPSPAEAQNVARLRLVHASAALEDLGPIDVFVNRDPATEAPNATVTFRNEQVDGDPVLEVPAMQALWVTARLQNPPPISGLPREHTFVWEQGLPPGEFFVTLAGVPEAFADRYAQNPEARIGAADRGDFTIFLQLILAFLQNWSGVTDGPGGVAMRSGTGVPVVVAHAVTDAPLLDVVLVETGQVLADDLRFGLSTPEPVDVAPGTYTVNVLRSSDQTLVQQSRLTVTGAEGALQFTATGFLDPSQNAPFGGTPPPFALATVDQNAQGTVAQNTSDEEVPLARFGLRVAPSPARSTARIAYDLDSPRTVRLALYDALGRQVVLWAEGARPAGPHRHFVDLSQIAPGAYYLHLQVDGATSTRPVTIVR